MKAQKQRKYPLSHQTLEKKKKLLAVLRKTERNPTKTKYFPNLCICLSDAAAICCHNSVRIGSDNFIAQSLCTSTESLAS